VTQSALGVIVTDANGYTLYRSDRDSAQPPTPTCYDGCSTTWPAYPWSDSLTVDGMDRALIGKVQRTDGTVQVTVNGWPAYRRTADVRPGDWTGQGVDGSWWAMSPKGAKASPAPSGRGGY
jgi:predicted lipoprotein with Yx(FWY)xxD motif